MSDRELCLIVWSFVAGVAFTLLVLRMREKRRVAKHLAAMDRVFELQERTYRQLDEATRRRSAT